MRSKRQKGDWYARKSKSKTKSEATTASTITAEDYAPLVRAEGRFL